jgi:hypothetical protein
VANICFHVLKDAVVPTVTEEVDALDYVFSSHGVWDWRHGRLKGRLDGGDRCYRGGTWDETAIRWSWRVAAI